jgi:DNA primase
MSDRPYVNFQEVKDKVPIPEALEKLGLADQFKRKGDVLTGLCPLAGHVHGPKPNEQQFKINKKGETWLWHCFGDCNRGGDVIELVKLVKGFDNAHVRFWFAEHFGDRLSLKRDKEKVGEPEPKASPATTQTTASEAKQDTSLKPLRFYLNLDISGAMPYLQSRGVSEQTARRYRVGLCGKGVLAGYLAMPIYRWPKEKDDENPVGYVGRWPGDDFDAEAGRPRYKVPSEFETSRVVFGLPQALAEGNQSLPLLAVEGPLKAMWLCEHGYPNTVSSFTASISEEQAAILLKTGRPIVLAFDGNEAGYNGMRAAAGRLITGSFVRVVKLPAGSEPDQLSAGELDQHFSFAKP